MTYLIISIMKDNGWLRSRVAACVALEGIADPARWAVDRKWELATQPGWADAWASALAGHPDEPDYDPGMDEGVVTDGMILASVQALIAEEDTPEAA